MAASVAIPAALFSQSVFTIQQWEGDVGTFQGATPTYKDHPDPAGDAGPNHIVHLTGQDFIVYDRSGNVLQKISTPRFFSNAGAVITGITSEPQIVYDRFIQRWIATTCDFGTGNDYVAVSAGTDPRSSDRSAWRVTTIVASGANDDTPVPAYDKNGVYIASYGGSNGGNHYDLNVFSPAALTWTGPGSIGAPTRFTPIGFDYFPLTDPNPNKLPTDPAILWYRSPDVQNFSGLFSLATQTITWSNGVPRLGPLVTTPTGFQYNTPVNANQPGGGIRGVENHRGAAFPASAGIVYAVFNSGPCASGCSGGQLPTLHDGFFWLKFRAADGSILDQGFEFDSTADFQFSDLVVDANGTVVISATCSDALTTFASACVFYRLPTDPPGHLTGPVVLKAGTNSYAGGCSGIDPPGYGLWSRLVTDFLDDTKLWLFAEYGEYSTPCQWATRVIEFQVGTNAAAPLITTVVNAASFLDGLSGSSWMTIQGTQLSGTARSWQSSDFVNNTLPTKLNGVSVAINGLAAYVSYISPAQINAIVPAGLAPGMVSVQVTNSSASSNALEVSLADFSPAFFPFTAKYPAAVHANGDSVGPPGLLPGANFSPAMAGETIMLFGTGFGPTNPPLDPGQLVPAPEPLSNTVTVQVGGEPAFVRFAGIVQPGLVQLNVTLPADLPNGDAAVLATIGGFSTQAGQFINIQN